jgi:hypothetical protein
MVRRIRKPLPDFLDWLLHPPSAHGRLDDILSWSNKQRFNSEPPISERIERYRQYLLDELTSNSEFSYDFTNDEEQPAVEALAKIRRGGIITYSKIAPLTLNEAQISHFMPRSQVTYRFKGCWFRKLDLGEAVNLDMVLTDCWIGEVRLEPRRVASLEVRGGGILRFNCPPVGNNPFVGPIKIDSVFLPSTLKSTAQNWGPDSEQPYRNLRAHLNELHNAPAAGAFQAAEERLIRHGYRWYQFNKLLSALYAAASDYGNSTWRPFWLMFAFLGLSTVGLAVTEIAYDVSTISLTDPMPGSWHEILGQKGCWSAFLRASLYSVQSVVNPFGLLSARTLLVATRWYFALGASVICFFSTLSLAMFILALRRRFKLS